MEAAATSAAREAAEMAVELESAARDAEEMAVEMEVAAREEASAAVIWEVGNQEGHSNGHSPLQRGSSPYSACAMMQRRCTPVGTVSRRKTSRALQSNEPTRRELSPSAHEASHSTRQLERNVRAHIVTAASAPASVGSPSAVPVPQGSAVPGCPIGRKKLFGKPTM